jgi:hypothetical protein
MLSVVISMMLSMILGGVTAKQLLFAGHQWQVRGQGKSGPGPNFWSEKNAYLDGENMVISIANDGTNLNCAEVSLPSALGFGKYEFTIGADVSNLADDDAHVVFGLFIYKDDSHELDIEFARWGAGPDKKWTTNADYVVQPNPGGNSSKAQLWTMPAGYNHTVHTVDWTQDRVKFSSTPVGSPDNILSAWQYSDRTLIPSADGMLVHLNLWLFNPTTVSPQFPGVRGIISDFKFTPPAGPPTSAPPTPAAGGQCSGCIGGTNGVCKQASGVCYPEQAGACPAGTTHC